MSHFARILLIVLAMVVATPLPEVSAASLWEMAGALTARDLERVDESGMEMTVREGVVTLTLARPTQVKVLTILGQPLSQQTLPAGVHRLELSARGIYIVRVGSVTRRVTI